MAKRLIDIEVAIDDKGSLKRTGKNATGAAQAVNNLGQAQNAYLRKEKGVAGATSNSTKAFSKMQQTVGSGGSTGLVQSYAILASNVFAATAAFNALRQAAQVQQLEEGLQFTGNTLGRNLKNIAEGLREVTGAAVSTAQAMRTTAIGVSAGFDSTEIKRLAGVAKGASLALGRDMGDALDRLTRGVAKLEPEILDELGILVRIDDAAEKYATTLGVSAESLSRFERQQAFLNETLEQGEKKYGDIADAIDPNPYDQLSASLANLAKTFVTFLNDTLKFGKVAQFLADNIAAMSAVAGGLALSLTKRIAPGLTGTAAAAAEAAVKFNAANTKILDNVAALKKIPESAKGSIKAIQQGSVSLSDFDQTSKSLTGSLGGYTRALNKATKEHGPASKQVEFYRKRLEETRAVLTDLPNIQRNNIEAARLNSKATAIQAISTGNLSEGIENLKTSTFLYRTQLEAAATSTTRASKALISFKVAANAASIGIKGLVAGLARLLPYLSLIVTVGTVLYSWFKNKFFPKDEVEEKVEKVIDGLENIQSIIKQFSSSSKTGTERLINAYIAYDGILTDVKDNLREIEQVSIQKTAREIATLEAELVKLTEQAGKFNDALFGGGQTGGQFRAFAAITGIFKTGQKDIEKKQNELAAAEEKRSGLEASQAKQVLQGTIRQLQLAKEYEGILDGIRGDDDPRKGLVTLVGDKELSKLDGLVARLSDTEGTGPDALFKDGVFNSEKFFAQLDRIRGGAATIREVFLTLNEQTTKLNSNINKFATKAKSEFDDLLGGIKGFREQYSRIAETDLEGAQEIQKQFLADLKKDSAIKEIFLDSGKGLQDLENILEAARSKTIALARQVKILGQQTQQFKSLTKGIFGVEALTAELENATKLTKIRQLTADIEARKNILSEKALETDKKYNDAITERKLLEESIIGYKERQLMLEQREVELGKQRLSLDKAREANTAKILSLQLKLKNALTGQGFAENARDTYTLAVRSAEVALNFAKQEQELLKNELNIRIAMFEAEALRTEGIDANERKALGLLKEQLEITRLIGEERVASAETELELVKRTALNTESIYSNFGSGGLFSGTEFADSIAQVGLKLDRVSDLQEKIKALQDNTSAKTGNLAIGETSDPMNQLGGLPTTIGMPEEITNDFLDDAKIKQYNSEISRLFLQTQAAAITPFINSLKSLGPEGEVAGALAEGSILIQNAFLAIEQSGITSASALMAVSAAIGSIASIIAASSKQKVAAIEQEIEMEKKRDGQSAKSVAKIRALEAKVEKEKRKAFERDKKAKMAQTAMNTAAAIMGIWSTTNGWDIPIKVALTAMVGAIGAAQMAIISGATYQGGGTSAGGGPTSVSVGGDRGNSVDLARANSPSGEMAYMRGDRGVGNMTNFQPGGFTGKRGMATGGNTGFMVGEQGPELFIPDRPGTILPADDTEKMVQSSPTNVNFTINTIDSQGVEDFLYANRGRMIAAIREAANSHGTPFLEDVNVFQDMDRAARR